MGVLILFLFVIIITGKTKCLKMRFSLSLLLVIVVVGLTKTASGWCIHAGGIGQAIQHCDPSVDLEACFARCQCYDSYNNPTHQAPALCVLDACYCDYGDCYFGKLITEPLCCTDLGGTTIGCDNYCDYYPENC